MTQGRFILSLDCEGKWGIADHLRPHDHVLLSTARLQRAYRDIIEALNRHDIAATFAVVGLFALSPEELSALPLEEIAARFPYCAAPVASIRAGNFDGWHGEWLRAMLGSQHEWASHGITHTPYDQMSADDVRFEHSLVPSTAGQTFIFPRNRVQHIEVLEALGIAGYRAFAESGKISRLAGEFNVFERSETALPAATGRIAPIPAGHFVNWKSGARRFVPVAVSRRRAAHMLDHAAATGGIVHFWTHPENIASAPDTLAVLDAILAEVAIRVRRGDILVETQIQHVNAQQHRSS
jgi:hypothetical protein